MTPIPRRAAVPAAQTGADFDAVVVGAGFGGLYMLHKLRDRLGLKVRAFEKADDVGGTWYWNRYPGALSDTHSQVYQFAFDEELLAQWRWKNRYLTQPEVLAYLNHVADRYRLRPDIQFRTSVTSLVFDEARDLWELRTDRGERYTAQFVVAAVGLLSAANVPKFAGREDFAGLQYHTGAWPAHAELRGKRVGVIGTGSTGVQFITAVAPEVRHLTVFQRTPQYSVPTGNREVSEREIAEIKQNFRQLWKQVRESAVAFGFDESTVPAMSVSEAERERIFQAAWNEGNGFYFMFGSFGDIATDRAANEAAAAFIRGKIAEIVTDPETARKLTPHDLYARRPLCDSGYYRTYNRSNVSLVDVKATPIESFTPAGIRTADGVEHRLDVVVYATGFDAVDGNYRRIDIRGRGAKSLAEHWHAGPTSYLGVATAGFPNLYMILGPNGPFTNLPPSIETQVDWIAELIAHQRQRGLATAEPTAEAEDGWTATCKQIAGMTLFGQVDSWIFGANIPGKTHAVMFYLGGLGAYRRELAEVAAAPYRGFELRAARTAG